MEASHYKNLLDRSSLGNCLTFIPKPQPQPQPQPQQELLGLYLNLQKTVAKQQMLLKAMFQNQGQPNVQASQERPNILGYSRELVSRERLFNKLYSQSQEVPTRAPVNQNYVRKEEAPTYFNVKGIIPVLGERQGQEGNMVARRQSSSETAVSAGFVEKYTINFDFQGEKSLSPNGEDLNEWRETFPIRRRNGFKEQRDFESPSGEEDCFKEPRKSNKLIVPKKPPSKAKHLWINYGRKIIEFAINNTSDQLQEKMKMIVGKLSSKKDFEDFFRVTMEDPENERNFKRTLGKLAIIFIKTHAETAFEGSKYKEQMIRQKTIVSSLIAKLISGDS